MTDSFDDLSAVLLNCSIKYDSAASHTRALLERVGGVFESQGVATELLHALDHTIEFGMEMDLTESGRPRDDWPGIQEKINAADIFVMGTPIWLGVKSSVATLCVERMYAFSGQTNDKGQYLYYGKTAGCVVTGNEDGVKACSMEILYAMSHIGYTIPPQADCGWIGEVGPGPSYGDEMEDGEGRVGFDSDFTNKNSTFMAWNLMHTARMLKDNGGLPAVGNTAESWTEVANARDQDVTPPG